MKKRVFAALLVMVFILQLLPAFAAGFSSDPDAVEKAAKSVLMLEVFDADNELIATGSGFVAFNNRTIVTNYHVIEGADWMLAHSDDGYEYMVTKVLTADEEKDIAICSFMSPTDLQPLELNADGELKRIESVVAIGSPKGLTNTISLGNISALFEEDGVYWVQFTAPISAGSSGGALFDDNGNVIGVTSATYDDVETQNINFAVHISEVEKLYQSWDGNVAYFEDYAVEANATPTPEPTATLEPSITHRAYTTLKKGDSGEEVRLLQEALIYYGYLKGAATGYFDLTTQEAVELFNICNFNRSSKIASFQMQKTLYEENPLYYNSVATPKPTSEQTATPVPTASPKVYVTLQKGDFGEEVRLLQEKLIYYGYLSGVADGVFGEKTAKAVELFAKLNWPSIERDSYEICTDYSIATNEIQRWLFHGNPLDLK